MSNLIIYCLSLHNRNYKVIKELGYIPVGLGKDYFSAEWLTDKNGENISEKNPYYGEYSFHYWFWKNKIDKITDGTWIGFCAYRRFWLSSKETLFSSKKEDFLSHIPDEWNQYNVILGSHFFINKMKPSKLFKHSLRSLIDYPAGIFEKNRNIKFQFNSFHGFGNLDKAIDLLDDENREDFRKFTEENNSYNMGNMFICNSKKIINDYYNSLFPWLKRCESIFGFNSDSYGKTRIYGFLAERYLPYWFNKYTKPLIWPIIFFDINSNQIKQ
jgi:hypothetical protein|tara:strand:+ start:1081 stop:1893 length:813 start_codon:yes stop_codon:yes gene_type:complete